MARFKPKRRTQKRARKIKRADSDCDDGGGRTPRASWEEIREWLASADYPENPPPGIAAILATMPEHPSDQLLAAAEASNVIELSSCARERAALAWREAAERLRRLLTRENLLEPPRRQPDLSSLSFDQCVAVYRALLCVPFSGWLSYEGSGYGDVLYTAMRELCDSVTDRLRAMNPKRAHAAIQLAIRFGERRRAESPPSLEAHDAWVRSGDFSIHRERMHGRLG